MSPASRALISRADLVRLLAQGNDSLERLAPALGYRAEAREPSERLAQKSSTPESQQTFDDEIGDEDREEALTLKPAKFWRLNSVDFLEAEFEQTQEDPMKPSEVGIPEDARAPAYIPPVPDSLMRRCIDESLAVPAPGRRIDVAAAVGHLARAESLERVPRKSRSSLPARVTVVLDESEHLTPFWRDQRQLVSYLWHSLGRQAVEVRTLDAASRGKAARPVAGEGPVLALSDLGAWSDSPAVARKWRQLGNRLGRRYPKTAALSLAASSALHPKLAAAWSLQPLQSESPPSHSANPCDKASDADRVDCVERLLTLASWAFSVEPGLLRALRLLIPGATLETESRAWMSPVFQGRTLLAATWNPTEARSYQQSFLRLPLNLRQRAAEAMRAWHGSLPTEVQIEERLAMLQNKAVPPGDPGEVDRFIEYTRRLASAAFSPNTSSPGFSRCVGRYVHVYGSRATNRVLKDKRLSRVLAEAWESYDLADTSPPDGLLAEVLQLRGEGEAERSWNLGQRGGHLRVFLASTEDKKESHLAEFRTLGSSMGVRATKESSPFDAEEGASLALPKRGPLVLTSGLCRVTLNKIECPPWASSIGRDRYGLWAAFEVGDASHRMRWIPPGRFLMGSPETEQGRYSDESPQHLVTLTRGYWLGEVPVTQDLWQAVMQENPSHFKDPERPVENVSWEKCRSFCQQINDPDDKEPARLPSEAEWEYACRAGSRTSTYAGELEIKGENNAPLLHELGWYGGNSGVDYDLETSIDASDWPEKQFEFKEAGTRKVGKKNPNAWGLFDTLGNVFEWCEDSTDLKPYSSDPRLDPVQEEGTDRVIRGGSWLSDALYVRAAYRLGFGPGNRFDFVGFRLARGQALTGSGLGGARVGEGSEGRANAPDPVPPADMGRKLR